MTLNQLQSQYRRMKVAALVVGATFVMLGLFGVGKVWRAWQRLQVQTISARLTSAGDVIWGDAHLDLVAIQPELESSADLLRSHGFKPRLLIEHYRDTQDADIEALARIGHDAGFDIIEVQAHNWASPESREPDQ